MAAAPPLPVSSTEPSRETAELAAEEALISIEPQADSSRVLAPQSPITRLPVELEVAIPVREFRVRNLLALDPGEVIETQWVQGEDMPLTAGDVQLAWTEFEVLDTQLAVRVTRLV
jgi:flagellar motor switch protein FliM